MSNYYRIKLHRTTGLRVLIGRIAVSASLAGTLSSCAVGPDYERPALAVPATYKELGKWQEAMPQDLTPKQDWWKSYQDPLLDSLIAEIDLSNQTLAQANANFRRARALAQASRSAYSPALSVNVNSTRTSANSRSGQTVQTAIDGSQTVSNSSSGRVRTTNNLNLDASWEIDVWGRIQRLLESDTAKFQASAGDLAATRLSAQAQLVQSYFQLHSIDAQQELLDRTTADYKRSVKLTQNQYDAGIVPRSNVVLAQTQLKTNQVQAIDLGVQRAQLEHAIALLVGQAPSNFTLPHESLKATLPSIPISLPSDLLQRRPDIAAAERRVAAANAEIGVAKSAYFPRLTLSATGGAQSGSFAQLLSLPNRFWSFGPALAQTLFDGGLRRAQVAQATAAYDGTVAAYRQTVLTGFQEVEDNLAALRILEQEASLQEEALALSRRSVELTNNQYKAGIVTYLNVIQVQTTALSNERSVLDVLNRRLVASVLLVKALGGGWDATALPDKTGMK